MSKQQTSSVPVGAIPLRIAAVRVGCSETVLRRARVAGKLECIQGAKNGAGYEWWVIPDVLSRWHEEHMSRMSDARRKGLMTVAETRKKNNRKCHDCGKPTNDFRCPACWEKLRKNAEDF